MAAQPKLPGKQGTMRVKEARQWVRDHFQDLVDEYRRAFPEHLVISRNEVRFLDTLVVRRKRGGELEVLQRTDVEDTWTPLVETCLQNLGHHLYYDIIALRLRVLAAQKLRDLTGRDYRLEHLTGLVKAAEAARDQILRDQGVKYNNWYTDLWPNLNRLQAAALKMLDTSTHDLLQCLGYRIFPAPLYNRILADRGAWLALRQENAALLPLVKQIWEDGIIPITPRAYNDFCRYVLSQGFKPRTWRTLFALSADSVTALQGAFPGNLRSILEMVEHFSEAGILPSGYHLQHALWLRHSGRVAPLWFDRAAAEEARQRKARTLPDEPVFNEYQFFYREYSNAADWLADYVRAGNEPDRNQLKAGWKWITRMSDQWHEDQVVRRLCRHLKWSSPVAVYTDGKFEVVPLTSSEDLAREGARMHHCVGGYDHYCASGRSRIFSIRLEGRSKATVELVQHGTSWRIHQNRGPCNVDPGKTLHAVAERLLKKMVAATNIEAAA